MVASVLYPPQPLGQRRNSLSSTVPPALPPRRRNTVSLKPPPNVAPLQLKAVTLNGGMETRYNRASSPRRYANPARSSTGTFGDPYHESSYYGSPSSPRSSADRIVGSHHQPYHASHPSASSRANSLKYDAYSGRPRRNTEERGPRPNVVTLAPTTLPIRTPYNPVGYDRPSSPLAKSWDKRGETFHSHGPARREHKKVYSVDEGNHATQLIAERDVVEPPRHRDSTTSITSGGRSYHNSKPPARLADLGDDGYSYTDPASMYRDTEPAWRRPRSGSLERTSRPSSVMLDRPARSSARELGPPPSTRGFGKIARDSRSHGRSSSIEHARDAPVYDMYPDSKLGRSSSTRQHAPAIHQELRRDTYHDSYDRRDRGIENRRNSVIDRYEDRDVASRGFGIAPGSSSNSLEHHSLDRQPIWNSQNPPPVRPDDFGTHYHSAQRGDAVMPEPSIPRGRDPAPAREVYDQRPREVFSERPRERESSVRDSSRLAPALAGAAAGAAISAAGYKKARDRERELEERGSSGERERRREREEKDRRDRAEDRRERKVEDRGDRREPRYDERLDRDDRREVKSDDRRDERREVKPEERRDSAPIPGSYPPPMEAESKPRDRRFENDEPERASRKLPSSEGSGDERPRHYVDREVERRRDAAPQEPTLDPDEEYRRRVQQEVERSGRTTRDRDTGEGDRDRERRQRRDERSRSRAAEERSRDIVTDSKPPSSRYDERSSSVFDGTLTQEPESVDKPSTDSNSKSVTIVTPSKEPAAAPKSILRKPTEKFPEDPDPIREGVAPHKDSLKGKDIPVGARWTRIDRRLVNPEALEEAKERFEERMDCVIVLRVLTKQDIQKLADRTKKIREAREDEYERRDRRSHRGSRDDRDSDSDREHRSYRGSRDDRGDSDRERDREYDHERDRDRERDRERRRRHERDDSDYEDLARERERDRDRDRERPKMLEPAR